MSISPSSLLSSLSLSVSHHDCHALLQLGKYLDRHLVFPLLEFLQNQKVYPEGEILEAKIQLLQKTNMLDFAADIYKSLHSTDDVPAGRH